MIVATCQLAPAVGEATANRQAGFEAIAAAAADGAAVVVVPELSDSGYVFADRAEALGLAEPVDASATLDGWSRLARELDVVVVGGWCELAPTAPNSTASDNRTAGYDSAVVYNSAAVVDRTGVRAVYRKVHLWDREKLVFAAGDDAPPVVDTPAGRIAVCVCYDLEFPEWPAMAARAGAELLAAPVNWPLLPRPASERPAEVVKVQAAAAGNGIYIAVADRCGVERGVRWVGGTMVVGPDGYPVTGPVLADEVTTLLAEVDLARTADKRINGHNHLFTDRRPELYR